MAEPITIDERYAYIPTDGPGWRILDSEFEWDEFEVPKKFANTPELAVELLEFISTKQQIAINSGFKSGRKSMQYDLRRMLGINGTE